MAVFGKDTGTNLEKIASELINRVNENIRRLRVLENRVKALDNRINSMEQNTLVQSRNLQKSLSERDIKITNLEEGLRKTEMTMKEILKQLKFVATKSDVEELKHFVDIYNPLKSKFVTIEEVENMINEKLAER
jgi:ABC-type phosphate transport system auxiliary subunit